MTPKEALAKDGFPVKQGRGRLSRAAIDRCKELAAQGWNISGYSVETNKSTSEKVVVKKVATVNEKVIADFVILFEEKAYKAVAADKKVYGMREVCNNCRVSLVQCHCGNPTILGDISVAITPR